MTTLIEVEELSWGLDYWLERLPDDTAFMECLIRVLKQIAIRDPLYYERLEDVIYIPDRPPRYKVGTFRWACHNRGHGVRLMLSDCNYRFQGYWVSIVEDYIRRNYVESR